MAQEVRVLLSPKEVRDLTGFSLPQLEVWRARREGPPFFKVGRMVKYNRRELEQWLSAQGGSL